MTRSLLVTIATFICVAASAQLSEPVRWTFSQKKVGAGSYEIHLTATIAPGWHTYSQTTPDGGPVPTAISWATNPLLTPSGATKEIGKLEQHHEDLFGVDVKQYSGKVDFVQLVNVRGNVKTAAGGSITFMVCNDRECRPPKTITFSVPLK